jgi:hypothetical protein
MVANASTKNVETSTKSQGAGSPGPFLAKVISHMDPTYMGGLEVEILRPSGAQQDKDGAAVDGQQHQVKYMSPFAGSTSHDYTGESDKFSDTQKSYGMWMVPPDVGCTVVVIFIDGDPKRGYWIGCVQDEHMNFMVPGLASSSQFFDEDGYGSGATGKRLPVAEFNKKQSSPTGDTTKNKKPLHPFAKILITSGLDADDVRGTTTSSARRETPSAVFGISTPGPIDKSFKKPVGKKGERVTVPVGRTGGSSFVMDDGDDKFLRKKTASEDKPEYASPEQGDTGGNVNIPHNELIRIRTRSGHQILLHNSEDLIYISHGSGNSWIEMTANGKIDVYAKDSISFHTDNDFNFSAGRDINFQATGEINMVSTGATRITPTANFEVKAANTNIDGGQIHLNSGKAGAANSPVRKPTKEPWAGHENLDPQAVLPDKTKAVYKPPETPPEPEMFKKPTTTTDTFQKVKGSSK